MGVRTPSYQAGFYAPERGGSPAYPQLWRGCVGAWNPGLGPSGLVLRDWSGYGNHCGITRAPSAPVPSEIWTPRNGRWSLEFADSSANAGYFASCTIPAIIMNDTFTLSAWVYQRSSPGGHFPSFIYIVEPVSGRSITLQNTRKSEVAFTDSVVQNVTWPSALSLNIFRHFAVSVTNKTATFYVDGKVSTTATLVAPTWSASTRTLHLGCRPNFGTFDGWMQDYRMYNRASTGNEISLLARRPGIAYELAPRKFISLPPSSARLRRILTGAT